MSKTYVAKDAKLTITNPDGSRTEVKTANYIIKEDPARPTLEKLERLYGIKDRLHPMTMLLITGFVETQGRVLGPHDIQYVEDVYMFYFTD